MLSPLRLRTARLSRLPHLGVLRTPVRTLRSLAQLENLDQIQPEERPAFKQAIESARETFSASATTFKKMSASSAKALSASNSILLTLSCPDQPGIVHKVTGFLAERQMNILDSAQFGDPTTKRFFMRVHASGLLGDAVQSATPEQAAKRLEEVRAEFESTLAKDLDMQFELHREVEKPRTLIMVSKIGHCLNDLLFRVTSGSLQIEVPLIVSNHPDFAALAKSHNIPFYHLPIDAAQGKTKAWQEDELMKLVKEYNIELVVLARYMQILSPKLCEALSGQIINIHHSSLPSFAGAKPYHQAYDKGVKVIGATAHLVTADLDEGPIIEQAVEKVNHTHTANDLVRIGADIEARVLARAVKWKSERRILLNKEKTVVFA